MPDADVQINPGSPPGAGDNMVVDIHTDNNSSTQVFVIENDGGGLARRQFVVLESGSVRVYGPLESSGKHIINCQIALVDPVAFFSNGTEVARVTDDGMGDFSTGGINLPMVTADPDGSRSGTQGELILFDDSGTYRLMVSAGGTAWNRA